MDSTQPAGPAQAKPKSTRHAEPSSPATGPTSTAGTTSTLYMPYRTLTADGTIETFQERPISDALMGPSGNKMPLICSSVGSPAKTSASPDAAPASPANEAACGGSFTGSSTLFDPAPYSWRTSKDSSAVTVAETWARSSTPWLTSGMASPGEYSTRSTSACPNGDDACSCSPSLADVLEPTVPPKYSLSPRAARGILRRAQARGRELPPALSQALARLEKAAGGQLVVSTLQAPKGRGWRVDAEGAAGGQIVPCAPASVRRLTPRECERLMGWPDDHTRWTHDGREVADSRRYAMCGNGVVAPVAQWIGERLHAELAYQAAA